MKPPSFASEFLWRPMQDDWDRKFYFIELEIYKSKLLDWKAMVDLDPKDRR